MSNDIFTLGSIFVFIITGNHPFGHPLECVRNIICGEFRLDKDIFSGGDASKYVSLIQEMLSVEPTNRPTSEQIFQRLNVANQNN